jgi:hypothetical protein
MSLEKISLSSLEKTKLQPLFQTALNEVLHSLYHETDIPGDRSITVKITFKPKDQYIITEMGCSHAVPGRKVNAIATLEDNTIKIDTVSGDARQPDLLEHAGANVIAITEGKKGAVQT